MKIYFAGSIQGGRQDAPFYFQIIELLKSMGHIVLSEHFGSDETLVKEVRGLSANAIYNMDSGWIRECDALIAEITQPSLGVGYELSFAENLGKPIVCLYRQHPGKRISAMIMGNPYFKMIAYQQVGELEPKLVEFLKLSFASA